MKEKSRSQTFLGFRRTAQWTSAIVLLAALAWSQLTLLWILVIGIATAPFGGKFFCRWICPMGLLMETLSSTLDSTQRAKQDYMYYKLGCPIAWVGGWLNRWSWVNIRFSPKACTHCGACDRACYLPANAPNTSMHQAGARFGAHVYQCSRCGACVTACPTQALALGTGREPKMFSQKNHPNPHNGFDKFTK